MNETENGKRLLYKQIREIIRESHLMDRIWDEIEYIVESGEVDTEKAKDSLVLAKKVLKKALKNYADQIALPSTK